jgi:hypothetical protein
MHLVQELKNSKKCTTCVRREFTISATRERVIEPVEMPVRVREPRLRPPKESQPKPERTEKPAPDRPRSHRTIQKQAPLAVQEEPVAAGRPKREIVFSFDQIDAAKGVNEISWMRSCSYKPIRWTCLCHWTVTE